MAVSLAAKLQRDPHVESTSNPPMNVSSGTSVGCQLHPQGYNPHSGSWTAAPPAPTGL